MDNSLTSHLLIAAALVAAFALLAAPLRAVVGSIARRFSHRAPGALSGRILSSLRGSIVPLMVVTALFIALREVRKAVQPADVTPGQILDYAEAILYVILIAIILRLLVAVVKDTIDWYLARISGDGTSSLVLTLGPLLSKAANVAVALVAVIIVLDHFGINIGSLLVSLGVGSLAVALAAQDTLANIIAGFVILVDRPFRVGDRVEIPTGVTGDVQEIGLRSTKVLNFDNNTVIIPNADLVKSRIVNYSYPQLPMRVQVKFEVSVGTDPAAVREILLGLARREPDLLAQPAHTVYVASVGGSSMQMIFEALCARFDRQFAVETALREQAYAEFVKRGIAIPVPQRVVATNAGA